MDSQDAVRRVYAASYRRLVVQMLALSGDQAEAEDAVQEAFVRAIGLGRRFARLDNPEAWLRTVALNQLRNRWRHLAIVQRRGGQVPGPAMVLELGPDHVALVAALATLAPDLRTVAVLHYVADRSVLQVARELDIPEGTVKSRLSRAREQLSLLLTEVEEHEHA